MGYKPPTKSNETFNVLARINLTKKGEEKYFRVQFTQKDGTKLTELYIKPENAPAYLINPETKKLATNEWRIKLSSDKTKIFSAVPSAAIVVAEFHGIPHREGQEPQPFKQTSTYKGNTFDVMKFTWMWKVCEGEFKDVEVVQYLNYHFDVSEDDKGREVVAYSKPNSKYTAELDNVLTCAGVWEYGAIAYVENVLPKLVKRANKAKDEKGIKVRLTLSDGYIVAVKPVAGGWDEEDTDYNPTQAEPPKETVTDVEEEVDETAAPEKSDDEIPWDEE
jgi:hypothetical protein